MQKKNCFSVCNSPESTLDKIFRETKIANVFKDFPNEKKMVRNRKNRYLTNQSIYGGSRYSPDRFGRFKRQSIGSPITADTPNTNM